LIPMLLLRIHLGMPLSEFMLGLTPIPFYAVTFFHPEG
jgi:hypothetical protein